MKGSNIVDGQYDSELARKIINQCSIPEYSDYNKILFLILHTDTITSKDNKEFRVQGYCFVDELAEAEIGLPSKAYNVQFIKKHNQYCVYFCIDYKHYDILCIK